MTRIISLFVFLVSLTLAACTAPAPQSASPQTRADVSPVFDAPADSPPPAPPTPPATTPPPDKVVTTGKSIQLNTSCTTDADCTVKNVGNCCGYYPACVNVNSPTDPKGVQANCQAKGLMGVCGFPEISACSCVAGKCASAGGAAREERVLINEGK